ncbi:MAG TPA: FAD-binding oxidoreductase, partial [Rhodanobacteraceae bacterium]|nr:FAD-binding oxidoreductase [Rhodanobacteraceae bacterium]
MTDPRLAALAARVPELRLSTEPGDLAHYGRDWTRRWEPAPLAVALPASIDAVQQVVCWANETGVALVPSGGRTGLSGGAVAANGELVLSLERMQRVLGYDAAGRTLRVEAGMTLHAVHEAARQHELIYPVDFAARGSCSIGGNIATNAGGIRVIRYGTTREWIAGLTVVDGRGELLQLNRSLIKNSSGYDLRQLVIGSEGTLGIVVEAELRLTDPPPPAQTLLLAVRDMDAVLEVFTLFRTRLRLQAFEFFTDRALVHVLAHGAQRALDGEHACYVVMEYDAIDDDAEATALACFETAVASGWVADGTIAQSEAQAQAL